MIGAITVPAGFWWRPARDADAHDVAALLSSCEEFDDGIAEVELSDVVSDWRRPGVDLDRMTAVVLDEADMVAFAQVIAGRAEAAVMPAYRGRGIGGALLAFTSEVARRDGRTAVGQTVSDGRVDAASLFLRHGYRRRWTSWILDIDVHEAPPPRLPDGYRLGTFRPADQRRAVFDLIDAAFDEWPDREGHGFADWVAQTLQHERFVAAASSIVEHDGQVVGAAINFDDGIEGWIHQLAVAPGHRGAGLGRALLAASFGHHRRRGRTTVGLCTDSRTGALTLYEHVGMRVRRSYTHWSRRLDVG